MTSESEFIASLRALAADPAARGLLDDAAVIEIPGGTLVLTHDMIVEGVHFRPDDPPDDVAWKLVAVNLSDLAGKGARPVGILLGYTLGSDAWDRAFAQGLATVVSAFGLMLLGGDTVAAPAGTARTLGLTAIGRAEGPVPSRAGARPGEHLWVTGTVGDAGAGLALLERGQGEPPSLIERYRNPRPRLEAGERLAPLVSAMMDVSDGLLIDASRLAAASGCSAAIALDSLPLSADLIALDGSGLQSRLKAASGGDDYELLFAAPADSAPALLALADEIGLPFSRIGELEPGSGLRLSHDGAPVPLPARLGFEHSGRGPGLRRPGAEPTASVCG